MPPEQRQVRLSPPPPLTLTIPARLLIEVLVGAQSLDGAEPLSALVALVHRPEGVVSVLVHRRHSANSSQYRQIGLAVLTDRRVL